jgi:hypothetical protein
MNGDGETIFCHACKLGLEGIVSKRQGLTLPFWPFARLAQDEERQCTGRQTWGRGGLREMTATSLNFALLDASRPEVARLIAAMVQARDAVE